jgi:hypothetical protein
MQIGMPNSTQQYWCYTSSHLHWACYFTKHLEAEAVKPVTSLPSYMIACCTDCFVVQTRSVWAAWWYRTVTLVLDFQLQ